MPVERSFDLRDLLEDRWKALGYEKLLPEERDYIVLWWLMAEVNNGTFHQYFYNSAGDSALEALASLRSLRATETHGILEEALATFGGEGYSSDRQERCARLQALPNQYEVFKGPTDRFYRSGEDFLGTALERVAEAYEKHHIEQPPGKPGAMRVVAICVLVLLAATIFVAVIVAILASNRSTARTFGTGAVVTNSPQPQSGSPHGGADGGSAVD